MIIVPVALSSEARVRINPVDIRRTLTYLQAMYDEVEQLSKKRVEACMRSNSTLVRLMVFSIRA